jgi:O-antigen/teichoic acid export membrane protein
MQYITYANLPRNFSILLLGYIFLSQGYSLIAISWLLSITYFILLLIEWFIIARFILKPRLVIDFVFTRETTKSSLSFLGFQGAFAISSTLLIFMLSKYAGEAEVGFYNASSQILIPLTLILQSVVLSVFPAMCRRFEANKQGLKLLSDNLVELFLGMTFPVVVCIFYLSGEILLLLYGNQEFLFATIVLQILVLTLIPQAVTTIFGRLLLAGHHENGLFKIVMLCSVFSIVIGIFLISEFGLMGAALTAVAFSLLNFILHYQLTARMISSPLPIRRLWKPVVASFVYVLFIVLVKGLHPFITAFLGGLLYLLVWLTLIIFAEGGFYQLTTKYKMLWSESL